MLNLDHIPIEKTDATATYNKSTEGSCEISRGYCRNRLCFPLPQNTDPLNIKTLNVYIEKIGTSCFDDFKSHILSKLTNYFIPYQYQDQLIYINIGSLSKRLGISLEKIPRKRYSQEQLTKLILKSYKNCLKTLKKVDKKYHQVIREKYIETEHALLTDEGHLIPPYSLYLSTGVAHLLGNKTINEAYPLKRNRILLIEPKGEKKDPILTLFTNTYIGEGAFGQIRKVYELSKGHVSIAKSSHENDQEFFMYNEHEILNIINPQNQLVGIQKHPHKLYDFSIPFPIFSIPNINRYKGYLAAIYDDNLANTLHKLKLEDCIQCMYQLLQGLVNLRNYHVCHGDIQAKNILYKTNLQGEKEFAIADFGGARIIKDSKHGPYLEIPINQTICDYIAKQTLNIKSKPTNDPSLDIQRRELYFQKDVYAMGLVFGKILKRCQTLEGNTFSRLKNLIQGMKNRYWRARLKPHHALEEFQNIFSSLI